MTDQADPTPAQPAPEEPPFGPGARGNLRLYFAANLGRYTREALMAKATAAGHPADRIEKAMAAVERANRVGVPEATRARLFAAAVIVVSSIAAWLLLTPTPRESGLDFGPLAHGIFAVALLVTGGASLVHVSRTRRLEHGGLAAVAVALVGPLVILLVLTGLCASVTR